MISKPIENIQSLINGAEQQHSSLATQYEYTKQAQSTVMMSEEARKKMRVDRLKRATANQEMMQSQSLMINDPQASEWDKLASLKQLEMLRETRKQNLLERVLKEQLACK